LKLISILVALLKEYNISLNIWSASIDPCKKQKMLSMKRISNIDSLYEIWKPLILQREITSLINLLRASVMIRKRNKDMGYPYRSPLEVLKNLDVEGLVRTTKDAKSTQLISQLTTRMNIPI